jgi:hypothetical protein
MSNGWAQQEVTVSPAKVVSGIVTSAPLTKEFRITAGGATVGFLAKVVVSAATVVGTITLKVESGMGADYVVAKSTTVSAAGIYYIRLMASVGADAAVMPLLAKGLVTVTTTNAGDSVTIASVEVLQEL